MVFDEEQKLAPFDGEDNIHGNSPFPKIPDKREQLERAAMHYTSK